MHSAKRKIIYLITKGNFGGAQRYVFDLATSLPKTDFDVLVVFGEGGALSQKLTAEGVRTIQLSGLKRDMNPFSDLFLLFRLIKIFKKEKPDIIHLNSSKIGGVGAVAGRIMRVPKIIFTAHGWAWNESRSSLSKILIKFLHWLTMIFTHTVITVSKNSASQIAHFPLISKKIKIVYNGVSIFETKDTTEARKSLSENIRHGVWIGTTSELHKNKGLDCLIEAFASVSKTHTDCGLAILGEGEERENLTQLISKKSLTDRVHLLGYVKNAKEYLKAFNIFTLTSRTEAFPYAILEAGIVGLPVLASTVGGIPEIIDDRENGILTKKEAVEKISEGLSFLLDNPEIAKKYGENLRKKVVENFSQQEMVNKTITLYN